MSYDKESPISQVYLVMGHFFVAPILIFLRTLVLSRTQLAKFLLFALSAKSASRAVWIFSRGSLPPTYTVVSMAALHWSVTLCHHAMVRRITTNLWGKDEARFRGRKPTEGPGRGGVGGGSGLTGLVPRLLSQKERT